MRNLHVSIVRWIACALVMVQAGCGGGGPPALVDAGGGGGAQPPSSPADSALSVRVTDTKGVPLVGAGVTVNGGFDGRATITDAQGEVTFSNLPAGDVSLRVTSGSHYAQARSLTLLAGSSTAVAVALKPLAEATAVILGVHAAPSPDGQKLDVELDVALLDHEGRTIDDLSDADFSVWQGCDWYVCLVTPTDGIGPVFAARLQSMARRPAQDTAAASVGFLVDRSVYARDVDREGRWWGPLRDWAGAIAVPGSAALATYGASLDLPRAALVADFTAGASTLQGAVDLLAGAGPGYDAPYLFDALSEMLAYVDGRRAAGMVAGPAALAVLHASTYADGGLGVYDPDPACGSGWVACRAAIVGLSDQALARSVPVVALPMGQLTPSWSTFVALRSGGAFANVVHASQLAPVLRRLNAIAGRGLAHYRVAVQLDAQEAGAFRSGVLVRSLTLRLRLDAASTPSHLDVDVPLAVLL